MHLSRVQIINFRNFAALDVALDTNVVMVGENRVGKSNFILALRLVLDTALPDAARQLKLMDIWDGCDLATAPEVQVHLDLTDFASDPKLIALLSYVFRKKADVTGPPSSEADYEFKVYGGGDETREIRYEVRWRICLDV